MKTVLLILMTFLCHQALGDGLLVSSIMANPKGTESPYEYVEILATKDIDFAETPFTLLFCNNGTILKPSGWLTGSTLTYAIEINEGVVKRGQTFYVGGDSTRLCGANTEDISNLNWIKTVDYLQTEGSASIGLKRVKNIGLIGNGGPSADGVAIFSGAAKDISDAMIPDDCVFYGDKVGESATFNYMLTDGTFLSEESPFYKNSAKEGFILKIMGTFDYVKGVWLTDRDLVSVRLNTAEDLYTEIKLVPSIYDLELIENCKPCLKWKSANNVSEFLVGAAKNSFSEILQYMDDSLSEKDGLIYENLFFDNVNGLRYCSDRIYEYPYWAIYDNKLGNVDTSLFRMEYNTIVVSENKKEPHIMDTLLLYLDSSHSSILYSDILDSSSIWSLDSICKNEFSCGDLFQWTKKTVALKDSCDNVKSYDIDVYVTTNDLPYLTDCIRDTTLYLKKGDTAVVVESLTPNFYSLCDESLGKVTFDSDSLLGVGLHEITFSLNFNGSVIDSCSALVDVRLPQVPKLECVSDTVVWTTNSYIAYDVVYPQSLNIGDEVKKVGDFSNVLILSVPDSLLLSFYVTNDYGYSDTCSYWVYARDSILSPTIECPSDTIVELSVLASGFNPQEATSSDGFVESLFSIEDIKGLQVGDSLALKFVAKDTLDGLHRSDTCFYWLKVVADSLPMDTTFQDTTELIPEHYIPTITCGFDTTIPISVLSAGYTPSMATSSDGIVETLFRSEEVLDLQVGDSLALKFVAKDTLEGSHHSDTCFYWLKVVADSLPM
ncbi:MAG: hypothetical protein MJZ33_12335, partial [Paludibacteraceae bacterium]|nr:hypothetical protein [Paludibacteraceae bacterium]